MGDFTGTIPTILGGDVPLGDDWTNILGALTALTAAWTAYTPTWTASAGTPAIGNGTLTGEYRRLGKTVDCHVTLTAGSTTTYGTGGAFWMFSIPVGTASGRWNGSGLAIDTGVLEYPVITDIGYGGSPASTTITMFKPGSGRFSNTSPFTFGTGDVLNLNITYQTT